MLMISSAAMAAPDSQQVGPYSVSFDLNANYQVQVGEPMETDVANVYGMTLFTDNSTLATIGIADYAEPTDSTLQVLQQLNGMSMMLQGLNITNMKEMVVDGKDGILIAAEPVEAVADGPSEVYRSMYWLDSIDCECGPVSVGTTSVTITSTYPLDVTEGLLSSLRIVKGEASSAAPAAGGQVLPPE